MADDNVLTKEGLLKHLDGIKDELQKTLTDGMDAKAKEIAVDAIKEKSEAIEAMQKSIKEMQDSATKPEILEKLQSDMATTIKAFDLLQSRMKGGKVKEERKLVSLGEALHDAFVKEFGQADEMGNIQSAKLSEMIAKKQPISFNLKNVNLKDMTQASSLTGDATRTYNPYQAIVPAQKINFRDLVPTVQSPTGLYATYKENTGEVNNMAVQTEGALKGQNEYAFTELKTVSKYIAGFTVITKQLLKFLPFMQATLPRLLLRDFYKKENAYLYSQAVAAATGPTSAGTSPDDVLQLIALIGAQLDLDYNVSTIVVSNSILARMVAATYGKGYYPGAGSVMINDSRGIRIFDTPVVGASWVTPNHALLIDNDYVERVETEGLNVTFSYEDSDNFRRNKVTVKAECMEELNVLRGESLIDMNLGVS